MGSAQPTFDRVIASYEEYLAQVGDSLSAKERHLSEEARDLLQQLGPLVQRISELNDVLVATLEGTFPGPEEALDLLRRAADSDPALAEWFEKNPNPFVSGTAVGSQHVRGQAEEGVDPEVKEMETVLYQDTILFYRHGHRLLRALRSLPGLGSIECLEVTIVRNQLMEHPEGKPEVTLPSFGWGTGGPRIKPMRAAPDSKEHQDQGLFHNAMRLEESLHAALSAAVASSDQL